MPKRTESDEQPPTLLKRAQEKASQMWSNWGKASGGWKVFLKLRPAFPSIGTLIDTLFVYS
jgi:hypothetical protein